MRNVVILIGFITVISTGAVAITLPGNTTPEPTLALDRIVVQLDRNAGFNPPKTAGNIYGFDIAGLDALCADENVEYIEVQFPGANPYASIDLSRFFVLHFEEPKADATALWSTIREFEESPYVESVEHSDIHPVCLVPNDTYYGNQWGLNAGWGIRAEGAWDRNTGNSNVIIAIADTGVDYDHPDLNDNIWQNDDPIGGGDDDSNGYVDDWCGWDFVNGGYGSGDDYSTEDNDPCDYNGHGTHCSGIASAETNNSTGVAGIGYSISIMCVRVAWEGSGGYGYVYMDDCAQGIYYAAENDAIAVNCSWGSSNSGGIASATTYATNHDCQVITAAGNNGSSSAPYLGTRSDVIAVAATTNAGMKPSWSNYGTWVDVSAPGSGIYSTMQIHGGAHTYSSESGTSMSAPFVVGLAGLIKSEFSSYDMDDIRDAIEIHCRPLSNCPYYNNGYMGEGLINAEASLNGGTGIDDENGADPNAPFAFTLGSSYPNPTADKATVSFALPGGYTGAVKLELYDIAGRKVATPLDESLNAGEHKVDIGTSNLANGVYLYKLTAGEDTAVKKMVVNR